VRQQTGGMHLPPRRHEPAVKLHALQRAAEVDQLIACGRTGLSMDCDTVLTGAALVGSVSHASYLDAPNVLQKDREPNVVVVKEARLVSHRLGKEALHPV